MPDDLVGVLGARAVLVSDHRYTTVLDGMIRRARARVWASMFAIDLRPSFDPKLQVLDVLQQLAAAQWRSVEARLLVGGSRTNLDMAELAATAVAVARRMGIAVRWITARAERESHAKYVIADDEVLLGSHNWSSSAFRHSVQDSIWIHSPAMAAYLCDAFVAQWLRPPRGARS